MRLIDADALGLELNTKPFLFSSGWNAAVSRIKDAPTIDPVRHEMWISETSLFGDYTYCSGCQRRIGAVKYRYCPQCGARMDRVNPPGRDTT